jgi:acyl carrier protein
MTDAEIRQKLADALEYSQVIKFRESGIREDFLAGKADMSIEALELDSLSSIELCIAIENSTGVSILLGDLWDSDSLSQLVAKIQRAQ